MHFMAVEKSKRPGFVIFHILKTVYLQQLIKGNQIFKLGMWKGSHLSIEGIRKGYIFRVKNFVESTPGIDRRSPSPTEYCEKRTANTDI